MKLAQLFLAGAAFSLALASSASAQVLGTRYIGAGVAYVDVDHVDETVGWGAEFNFDVFKNDTVGVDLYFGVETAEVDVPTGPGTLMSVRDTSYGFEGVLYFLPTGALRPYVSLVGGFYDTEKGGDDAFYYGVSGGLEYQITEQVSVIGGVYLNDGEHMDSYWSAYVDLNAWFTENLGAGVGVSYSDDDFADVTVYSLTVRYRL